MAFPRFFSLSLWHQRDRFFTLARVSFASELWHLPGPFIIDLNDTIFKRSRNSHDNDENDRLMMRTSSFPITHRKETLKREAINNWNNKAICLTGIKGRFVRGITIVRRNNNTAILFMRINPQKSDLFNRRLNFFHSKEDASQEPADDKSSRERETFNFSRLLAFLAHKIHKRHKKYESKVEKSRET